MVKVVLLGTQFDTKKQVLIELAFCHYPVCVEVDGKEYVFEQFSDAEKFIKSLKD